MSCFVPVGRPVGTQYYFVLDGKRMPPSYKGMTGNNDTLDLYNLTPHEAASASALLGLPLQLRKNPEHRIEATFVADKHEYAPGDPITVSVTIKNLDDEPIHFRKAYIEHAMFSFVAAWIGRVHQGGVTPPREAASHGPGIQPCRQNGNVLLDA